MSHEIRAARATFLLGCAVAAQGAWAQPQRADDRSLDLEFSIGHTDNMGRDDIERSSSFREVALAVRREGERPRMTNDVSGEITYTDYDFETDTPYAGNIGGNVGFILVPEVFDWSFSDIFGTIRDDPFEAASPTNRQYLNVFETGPQFRVPLGQRSWINIESLYEDQEWQQSTNLDSESVTNVLGLARRVSSTQTFGLSVSERRVTFDEPRVLPYNVESAYLTYARTISDGVFNVDAGRTRLDYSGAETVGPLLRMSWDKALNERSSLRFFGRREFQDGGDELATRNDWELTEDGFGRPTADPFTHSDVGISVSRGRNRVNSNFSFMFGRDRQQTEFEFDRDTKEATFNFRYPLGLAWSGDVAVYLVDEDYLNTPADAVEYTGELSFRRRVAQNASLEFSYMHRERKNEASAPEPETRAFVSLAWDVR